MLNNINNIDFQAILENISDEKVRTGFGLLLNLIEELVAENRTLRDENQRLRDEINRLKGEQGKPDFKPPKPPLYPDEPGDHSSEKERHKPKDWRKGAKLPHIKHDRVQELHVDPAILPRDAVRKGYEEVIVQDVVIQTDNVLFIKEKWYSPSTGKTYLAELPKGYHGEFGPGLKSLVLALYFGSNMSQPKILELLTEAGVILSAGTLSRMLSSDFENFENFEQEYDEIYRAGLESSSWQGTDHTSTTINGEQQQCQVVGNTFYSIYATTVGKDRLSILAVLQNQHLRSQRGQQCGQQCGQQGQSSCLLNEEAHRYLEGFKFSGVIRGILRELPQNEIIPESVFKALLTENLPQLTEQQFKQVLDAAAIAAYHAQEEWPVVHLLLCDDAPAFKGITVRLQLCWVHEGRHYKKLVPVVPMHRESLEEFRKNFWGYYDELLAYREHPTAQERERLSLEFDRIFSQRTGYQDLDRRIELTRAKKGELLTVLEYPEVPLHNNDCELAARGRVRKRDVSFGPRSQKGSRAWDIFMSLGSTARKLGVNFQRYLYDRISKSYRMPSLASLIEQYAHGRANGVYAVAA